MKMQSILNTIRSLPQYQTLLTQLKAGKQIAGLGLPRAARLPVLAALLEDIGQPILFITDRSDHALSLFDELGFWVRSPRYHFAEPNPLFYEQAAWGVTTRRDRLQALTALSNYHLPFTSKPETPPVFVTSVRSLMTRTMPRRDFLKACKKLSVDQSIQPDTLLRSWAEIGYQRVNTVLEPGQFSSRGGILDIWATAETMPVRLDFFGDEIETIRKFDPASQRTIEKLDSILVTPAREYLFRHDHSAVELLNEQGNEEQSAVQLRIERELTEQDVSEFHLPLLHSQPATLLDYLPQKAIVLIDDLSIIESMAEEIEAQAVKFRQESIAEETLSDDFPLPYVPWSELYDGVQGGLLEFGYSVGEQRLETRDFEESLAACFGHGERFAGRLKPFIERVADLTSRKEAVLIVSRQAKRLEELWFESNAEESESSKPVFIESSLSEGFTLSLQSPVSGLDTLATNARYSTTTNHPLSIHLISDSEIFGWERPQPRTRQRPVAETPESVYADLNVGDYVVHIDHGVGRFGGLVQRELDNHAREFLAVEYDGGGQLFVPVHQADRLTRYVGAEGAAPALDRLGGQEWHEKKGRVKAAVLEVAQEMLDLYARRHVALGYSFKPDTAWQKELEDSFPYVETEDQLRALNDIKRDMESSRPMDRLLCGDVGYGKTEVALRVAFKAVMDGKQVAILVPTTVLAQQHYETFLQRLAAFPVKVEMLSRFRTPREQTTILHGLAIGEIDIVVGTHRLISGDVQFKELGLVVIDEEQRFGVTHKEHLKKLRTEVDVLTLTATPIPRTLYMALTGVRDISNLNTPPEERLPIVTHVGPYSPKLVRQAILRELERGGQIFFVHNRVQTIDAMRAHLNQLVPEANVDIGHGQMPENQLSDVMRRFNNGDTDILLSTTIIESGLDIPNANTLIVDRADTFGLAQLYQLRGRVGRGAVRAYSYFFRHNKLTPTVDGQQRLEVIAENTQLGAGYSIAMRDLEIRGAGDLLGTRQSGHIQAVGFHLYTRLLADAVRQIRRIEAARIGGEKKDESPFILHHSSFSLSMSMPVNVDLPLAVGIPAEYIPDQDLRLRLYRRIADLRDETEIDALASEFKDRFGELPEMTANLFYQMRVKLRAEKAGLSSINWESGQIVLRYPTPANGTEPKRLADLGAGIRGGKSAYWCSFGEAWEGKLLEVLGRIGYLALSFSAQ